MEVLVKKTFKLSDEEIVAIYASFEEVLGQKRDAATFREGYPDTPLEYFYHSILLNGEGDTVSFYSCMPSYYQRGNERFMVALGIDSMVREAYRDYFSFRDMIVRCQKRLKEDGCVLRIGFPNDSSYPILKKRLKYQDVGKLTTYCMIRSIGMVKGRFASLNISSRILPRMRCVCFFLSISHRPYSFKYHKERKSSDKVCYRWFGGDYRKVSHKGSQFAYKLERYGEVETTFLSEVWPLSRSTPEEAIRYIYRKKQKGIGTIIYVGNLPFTPIGLFSAPHHSEPKHFDSICKSLVKDFFDDLLHDTRNWEVNLSNYDLL